MSDYFESQSFEDIDYKEIPLAIGEYENCTFIRCDLHKSKLSGIVFIDCVFRDCDLTMVNLYDTALQNVIFESCKIIGVDFEVCSQFLLQLEFNQCQLDHSSFINTTFKKLIIKGESQLNPSSVKSADFTNSIIPRSVFEFCDLHGAVFNQTQLEKADLSAAYNFSIDPDINFLQEAQFSYRGMEILLKKYKIRLKEPYV